MAAIAMALALPAQARNITHQFLIADALQSAAAQKLIKPSISLYFGTQLYTQGETRGLGIARGKEKTEAEDEKTSCYVSFAEAIFILQKKARKQDANAIVNIVSYYTGGPAMSSETQFECHGGSGYTSVILRGDFIKLPQ